MNENKVRVITRYLLNHSITDTANFFSLNRKTIYRLKLKYHLTPPRHHAKRFSLKELEDRWKIQDECDHKCYVKRCSFCHKVIGSESK